MLKMLIAVPVIMVCATVGTIGLLKVIQRLVPNASQITGVMTQKPEQK